MNKFWTLLLASSMVLGLCGCQRNVEESPIKDGMAQTEGTGVQVVQTGSGVTVKTAQDLLTLQNAAWMALSAPKHNLSARRRI